MHEACYVVSFGFFFWRGVGVCWGCINYHAKEAKNKIAVPVNETFVSPTESTMLNYTPNINYHERMSLTHHHISSAM